jgi:hypothetical protein
MLLHILCNFNVCQIDIQQRSANLNLENVKGLKPWPIKKFVIEAIEKFCMESPQWIIKSLLLNVMYIYMFIHQSRALGGHEQLLQYDYTDYNSIL